MFAKRACVFKKILAYKEVMSIRMDEETEKETRASARVGIDYAVALGMTAIDKSDCENKRDLVYSLLCFGCMFDDRFAAEPSPVVKKYDCLHLPEPQKIDLYELTDILTGEKMPADMLRELRKSWYMLFAYVLISGAPHSPELYEKLCGKLHTEEVFADVLQSRYSVFILPTEEELAAQGAPTLLLDWYAPYLRYCAERDEKNVTRETRECKRLLAAGQTEAAYLRAERLLAAFPDDREVAITAIAARVTPREQNKEERARLLNDTLQLIEEYMDGEDTRYFRYYRGLALLGLMDPVGAREAFEGCLEEDPHFELASFMLRAMDKMGQ